MLKFGNKEFRNLQEQVYANMKDIAKMKEGVYVLDEFGIKVVGEVESLEDLPTVAEYKEEHEDWAYGDTYAVGTEAPYALYILTRANDDNPDDYWFDIGEFPMPGPQGETGAQGPVGPQGPQGNTGASGTPAGFGTITATAETLVPGSSATATVVASGPDSEKSFAFTFGIPRGQDGEDLDVNWGEIEGTLSNQTDLANALQGKQNAILNYDSSTADSVTFKDNIILKNEANATTTIGRGFGLLISTDQTTILNASNSAIIPNLDIRPLRDNAISVGIPEYRIKDLAMAGAIKDGTHTFTLPSNTGTLLTNNDLKTINNESIIGSGNIDIQSAVWGNITGTLSNQTDLQNALNAKQDTISDLATIRSGAALGATAVQPSALDDYVTNSDLSDELQDYVTETDLSTVLGDYVEQSDITNMVTTDTVQTITADKTFSGKLNKNANNFGLVFPGTSTYTQNKVIATTDLIKEIYQHYITFKANSDETVVSVKVLTQGNEPMTAAEFCEFVFDEIPDATGTITATGTARISGVDHKYVGAIGRGSSNSNITLYTLVSTGGYGSTVTLNATDITSFVDKVDRVGAHGAGASGSGITSGDVIDALGYVPSHVDANPATTTNTLTSIGIDGINYALPTPSYPVTDVTLGGTSVVTNNVAVLPAYPVVPTTVSSFTNDAGYITSSALSGYATESWVGQQGYLTSVSWNDVSGKPTFATVATSGDYDDLLNKPTIPAAQVQTDWNATTGMGVLLNKPSLATVATSGSYTDLSDTPSLSSYVTTNTAQTISGQKTFTSEIKVGPTGSGQWSTSGIKLVVNTDTPGIPMELPALYLNPNSTYTYPVLCLGGGYVRDINIDAGGAKITCGGNVVPEDSTNTLGSSTSHWSKAYIDLFNPNYLDYGYVLPSSSRLTANKTIATTDDIPTVPVQDVTVNGTSVVSSGTAAISVPTSASTTVTASSETFTFTYADGTTTTKTFLTAITGATTTLS